jgi:outer membrane immunogenic protein
MKRTTTAMTVAAVALMSADAARADDRPMWTGVYLGAYGAMGNGEWTGDPSCTADAGCTPTTFAPDQSISGKGGVGGFYAGAGWQMGNIVIGGEADTAFGRIEGENTFTTTGGGVDWDVTTRIDSIHTLRARLGLAVGPVLVYGTAGGALATTHADETVRQPMVTAEASDAQSHFGWVAGAGVEWQPAKNWIIKGEWLHFDLGESDYNFEGVNYIPEPDVDHLTDSYKNAKLRFDLFKIGAAYKF